MQVSQLISQKRLVLHDEFGLPLCLAQVGPVNGCAHPPTGEVYADLQCASRAFPRPRRAPRADLNRPVDRRAPATRRGGTACQMVQRRAGPFFSALTLFYNYELSLVRRWRSEKPPLQARVRVCVQNVHKGRVEEQGEIGEEDGLAPSEPSAHSLGQFRGTH